jgi:hypothetical protein
MFRPSRAPIGAKQNHDLLTHGPILLRGLFNMLLLPALAAVDYSPLVTECSKQHGGNYPKIPSYGWHFINVVLKLRDQQSQIGQKDNCALPPEASPIRPNPREQECVPVPTTGLMF